MCTVVFSVQNGVIQALDFPDNYCIFPCRQFYYDNSHIPQGEYYRLLSVNAILHSSFRKLYRVIFIARAVYFYLANISHNVMKKYISRE